MAVFGGVNFNHGDYSVTLDGGAEQVYVSKVRISLLCAHVDEKSSSIGSLERTTRSKGERSVSSKLITACLIRS